MTNDKEWGVPLNNIVDYARLQSTQPRRQMFVKLLAYWIDKGGDEDAAREAIIAIQKGQVLTERSMPREFMPRFRSEILASKLIEIISKIDQKISSREEKWDWAHVMKVMIDEGIIMKTTPNKFDQLICGMLPGKGRDNVRKNGDYSIINKDMPWTQWTNLSHLNPSEAQDRTICNMIAMEFQPILQRKIVKDY
jgi:hypothetical protein